MQFEEKFEDDNPIKVKKFSFKRYQLAIDVLLEGKNKSMYQTSRLVDLVSFRSWH